MSELRIRIAADGTNLAVPASLDAITTYVLLEQEAWFEKEVAFVSRYVTPGMTLIDIGANLGVYSIPMARLAGADGQVFAYEPATETREFLQRSASLNSLGNLQIIPLALSDKAGTAHLSFGASSELNALGSGSKGERVETASLDGEDRAGRWTRSPDFVKIDAEGEEGPILKAAGAFFARHSPLVMFEIKAGDTINHQLRQTFVEMGYQTFRLLAGAPILVPYGAQDPLDTFELNLFAAKPERAAQMAAQGLLVRELPTWTPDRQSGGGLELFRDHPFGHSFQSDWGNDASIDALYLDCLQAYGVWRAKERDLGVRSAALAFALSNLRRLCETTPTLPRLSTLARVAWEAGQQSGAVNVLNFMLAQKMAGEIRLDEPFWPASPRFDTLSPGQRKLEWFQCSTLEQLERISSFSTRFAASKIDLSQLCRNPFAATEMERRQVLQLARAGQRARVGKRLTSPAHDHVNAKLWRSGKVPNTVIR